MPFALAVRLWDTYVAEGGRMKDFLTYVLAAFLLCWAPQLRTMDFQARAPPPACRRRPRGSVQACRNMRGAGRGWPGSVQRAPA